MSHAGTGYWDAYFADLRTAGDDLDWGEQWTGPFIPRLRVAGAHRVLNGTVNPNGLATTWHFEYGTSTSYGSQTAAKNAGSGTSSVSVSASLTGLTVATTYHYRLVAKSASGSSFGSDQSFSTSFPPGARTGPAKDVGGTTATLTGSVDPKGRPTTWYFEYGTTTAYGVKTPAQSAGSASGDHNVATSISALRAGDSPSWIAS